MRLIVDAHLDLAWNALAWRRDITAPAAQTNQREAVLTDDDARGHATTALPDMRCGGVALCLGTLLARSIREPGQTFSTGALSIDFPSRDTAYAFAQGQLAYYRALANRGEVALIRDCAELDAHWNGWQAAGAAGKQPVGLILAMEGADPILAPEQAADWFDQGLRCASLVHYGRSAYAVGTGDDGPLTEPGRLLLGEFERLGIILDVTHLSDTSFFEAMELFHGPVLASHQNCRALVPGGRQFSDEQLRLVMQRGGVVGAALDAWMLHPGWRTGQTPRHLVGLEAVADHIDHVCQLAGNHLHAAIGSDLDGGFGTEQSPDGLDTIADLQKLDGILASRGYSDDAIDAIFHGNLIRFLGQHLPGGAAVSSTTAAMRTAHEPKAAAQPQ